MCTDFVAFDVAHIDHRSTPEGISPQVEVARHGSGRAARKYRQPCLLKGKPASNQHKRIHVHWIEAEKQMCGLGVSSKLNARMDLLLHVKEIGRQAADQWIASHFDAIGQRSTIDIAEKFL